jgi:hypothetical protein
MGRKKIVDVGWSAIGADMDRVEGALRRKEEERRIKSGVERLKKKQQDEIDLQNKRNKGLDKKKPR